LTLAKKFSINETKNIEFRAECYNILNHPEYQVPGYNTVSGSQVRLIDGLPTKLAPGGGLPTGSLQPGLPYTTGAAGGNFGAFTQTVSNTVGSGTNRQFQLALRFNF
jgi:hypothetical protein